MWTPPITLKYIIIDRAEGPQELCGKPVVVKNFEAASKVLAEIAGTAPDSGGYDKTDFVIVWSDGMTYMGRADIKRGDTKGYDLVKHVTDFLGYMAGVICPSHFNDVASRAARATWASARLRNEESGEAASAREFLGKYFPDFVGEWKVS